MRIKVDRIIAEMDFVFNPVLNPGATDSTVEPFMKTWLPVPSPAYDEYIVSGILLYDKPDF